MLKEEKTLSDMSPMEKLYKKNGGVELFATNKLMGKPFLFKSRLNLAKNELASAIAIKNALFHASLNTVSCGTCECTL